MGIIVLVFIGEVLVNGNGLIKITNSGFGFFRKGKTAQVVESYCQLIPGCGALGFPLIKGLQELGDRLFFISLKLKDPGQGIAKVHPDRSAGGRIQGVLIFGHGQVGP